MSNPVNSLSVLSRLILDAIAGRTPQDPMSDPDLAALVLATPEVLRAEIESLQAMHLVNTCMTTRDGFTFYEVWPTGLKPGTVKTMPLVAERAYVKPRHYMAPPVDDAPHKAHKEPIMKRLYEPHGHAKVIYELIHGKGPIRGTELAKRTGATVENLWQRSQPLIQHGLALREKVGGRTWYMIPEQADAFRARMAETSCEKSVGPEPKAQAPERTEVPVPDPAAVTVSPKASVRYMLGDDGSLTIQDDDTTVRIEPADAARLAEFLAYCAPVFGL